MFLSPAEYHYFKTKPLHLSFISSINTVPVNKDEFVTLPKTFTIKSKDQVATEKISINLEMLPIPLYATTLARGTTTEYVVPYNLLEKTATFTYSNLNENTTLRIHLDAVLGIESKDIVYDSLGKANNFTQLVVTNNYVDYMGILEVIKTI